MSFSFFQKKSVILYLHFGIGEAMKVSIITAVYNSEQTIKECMRSIKEQTYSVEHIIIDGKSTDNSLSIIKQEKLPNTKIISEADRGIYDALNKGFSMASGDIIGLLHSDDTFAHNKVIEKIVNTMVCGVDSCYADLLYRSNTRPTKIIRYWKSGAYKRQNFYFGWMPPHPTFFAKKEIYDTYGSFNLSLGSAADYELLLRFLLKHKISTTYIPEVLVNMKVGGASNESIKARLLANKMDRKAWKINNLKPLLSTLYMKPIRKIPQYFIGYKEL